MQGKEAKGVSLLLSITTRFNPLSLSVATTVMDHPILCTRAAHFKAFKHRLDPVAMRHSFVSSEQGSVSWVQCETRPRSSRPRLAQTRADSVAS